MAAEEKNLQGLKIGLQAHCQSHLLIKFIFKFAAASEVSFIGCEARHLKSFDCCCSMVNCCQNSYD